MAVGIDPQTRLIEQQKQHFEAISTGDALEAGASVLVIEVHEGRLVVEVDEESNA